MGGDYLKVDHWPETLSTPVCTTKVCPAATHKGFLPGITCTSVMRPDLQGTQQPSKDVLWEDLLDYSEIEAEEDFLQQHIALLVSDYKIVLCPSACTSRNHTCTCSLDCRQCLYKLLVCCAKCHLGAVNISLSSGMACADGPKYAVQLVGGPVCTRQ